MEIRDMGDFLGLVGRLLAVLLLMVVVIVADHRQFQKVKVKPWLRTLVASTEVGGLVALGAFWVVKSEIFFGLVVVFGGSILVYVALHKHLTREAESEELLRAQHVGAIDADSLASSPEPPARET